MEFGYTLDSFDDTILTLWYVSFDHSKRELKRRLNFLSKRSE